MKNPFYTSLRVSGVAAASFFFVINLYWMQIYHGFGYAQNGFLLFIFCIVGGFYLVTLPVFFILFKAFELKELKTNVLSFFWGAIVALMMGQLLSEMAV